MPKEARIYNGEKTASSIIGAGETEELRVKIMKLEHSLTPYTKINSKWIKDINVILNSIELLKENIGRTLFDINLSNMCFNPSPRVMEIKTKI